jgi:hypothetical protein
MPAPDFFGFLSQSLEDIRRDEPKAHRALVRAFGAMRARLVAGGDGSTLQVQDEAWRLDRGYSPAEVEVRFDREATLDLIGGRLALEDAILSERLQIFGSPNKVELFYDALLIYIEALVRSPRNEALLKDYSAQ